ncbi:hypothetical protein DFH09DRAFT_1107222, partial [Mycena vulgaris]
LSTAGVERLAGNEVLSWWLGGIGFRLGCKKGEIFQCSGTFYDGTAAPVLVGHRSPDTNGTKRESICRMSMVNPPAKPPLQTCTRPGDKQRRYREILEGDERDKSRFHSGSLFDLATIIMNHIRHVVPAVDSPTSAATIHNLSGIFNFIAASHHTPDTRLRGYLVDNGIVTTLVTLICALAVGTEPLAPKIMFSAFSTLDLMIIGPGHMGILAIIEALEAGLLLVVLALSKKNDDNLDLKSQHVLRSTLPNNMIDLDTFTQIAESTHIPPDFAAKLTSFRPSEMFIADWAAFNSFTHKHVGIAIAGSANISTTSPLYIRYDYTDCDGSPVYEFVGCPPPEAPGRPQTSMPCKPTGWSTFPGRRTVGACAWLKERAHEADIPSISSACHNGVMELSQEFSVREQTQGLEEELKRRVE